jgi:2,4-dienoyl-CoA reductase-like NADH-dependent reductase (Old Yellow Enzyme family)
MKLFEPIHIGHLKIKNRIAFAPTHMGYCTTKGEITDQVLCHYSARAKGGAGLIIVEGTGLTGKYAFTMGRGIVCMGDFYRKGLKELAEVIHFAQAKAVVQLVLGQGAQALFSHPRRDLVAPSAISARMDRENLPKALRKIEDKEGETARALTREEIAELIQVTVQAAKTLKEVGFDGVELHGAHGYLLAEFTSPRTNLREDEYGGSFEKRLTLPLRLIEGIRQTVKGNFVIGYRLSGSEHVEGGLGLEESVKIAASLEKAGIDYLHLSSGCYEALKYTFPEQAGAMIPEAQAFTSALGIPVICPNIHDPRTAEKSIDEGLFDMASLSRSLIADPDWPNKAQDARFDDINHCVFCYTCVRSIMVEGTGVRCSRNPDVGWERFIPRYFPEPQRRQK